ncbi:MAG: Sporulation kinase E [Syntrophorhabdaceae bacterium PtaU1.Bin034]|nr:MAG: Sporulation kinase E [Syntrophorhabdaceae bacterium PtaU1.Bin034]
MKKEGRLDRLEDLGKTEVKPGMDKAGVNLTVTEVARCEQIEQALHRAEQKYRDIFENATEGIFQASPDRRFLNANPALSGLLGFNSPSELIDEIKDIRSQLFVDPERHAEMVRLLKEHNRVRNFEARMKRKDGAILWISMNIRTVRGEDGKVLFYGTMSDVTEHKEAVDALHRAEQKYRDIFENATEGIFQIGRDGRFLSANPALAYLHGYNSPEELIEQVHHVREDIFVDPGVHKELIRLLKEHDRVQNFEARMKRRDGSIHWISINVRTVHDENGRILFHEGTMRSISKRKAAEAALAESEKRYRIVIEHSNDGIAIAQGGANEYVNPRLVEMFGYDKPEEIIGHPLTQIVHPDDRERVLDIHARRLQGRPVPARYEFKGIKRDGETIYIEVSAAAVEYRNLPGILIFMRDMTDRKRAEEVFLHSHRQLEQLNRAKTKAVNHISHELKTPLAVIQGNVRLLRRKVQDTPFAEQLKVIIETTEKNLERLFRMQREADEILRTSRELEAVGLLDEIDRLYARLGDLSEELPSEVSSYWEQLRKWVRSHVSGGTDAFQPLDLYPFLLQAVERAKHRAAHRDIDLRVEGVNDIYVLMDPAILRDVVDGLVRNAIENTPDGGFVTVSVEEKDNAALLHVTDSGVGIAEENQKYIFDGLFHAKETEVYASKQPYDFDAGGKGLDLLRMKILAERFGFELSVKSKRCRYLPGDMDTCPGGISLCDHARVPHDCFESGGTTFTVSFIKTRDKSELPISTSELSQ